MQKIRKAQSVSIRLQECNKQALNWIVSGGDGAKIYTKVDELGSDKTGWNLAKQFVSGLGGKYKAVCSCFCFLFQGVCDGRNRIFF